MGPFENLNFESFSKNFFKNLNPGSAPYYFLIIASLIAMSYGCEHIFGTPSIIIFVMLSLLMVVFLYFASKQTILETPNAILAQLRVNRVTGIGVAIIGFVYGANHTQHDSLLFYLALSASLLQITAYLYFNERNIIPNEKISEQKIESFNIPQFTLITSAFLITLFSLMSEFAIENQILRRAPELDNMRKEFVNVDEYNKLYQELTYQMGGINNALLQNRESLADTSWYGPDSLQRSELKSGISNLMKDSILVKSQMDSLNQSISGYSPQRNDSILNEISIYYGDMNYLIFTSLPLQKLIKDNMKPEEYMEMQERHEQFPSIDPKQIAVIKEHQKKYVYASIFVGLLWFISLIVFLVKGKEIHHQVE